MIQIPGGLGLTEVTDCSVVPGRGILAAVAVWGSICGFWLPSHFDPFRSLNQALRPLLPGSGCVSQRPIGWS